MVHDVYNKIETESVTIQILYDSPSANVVKLILSGSAGFVAPFGLLTNTLALYCVNGIKPSNRAESLSAVPIITDCVTLAHSFNPINVIA